MVKEAFDQKIPHMESKSVDDLAKIAAWIIEEGKDYNLWLFEGEMGAGKTTLIKAISKALAIVDTVSSPTFSLVHEYRDKQNETFYHFDFYRLNRESEAIEIGVDEYFSSGELCFVEWASKIPSLLPDRYLKITIQSIDANTRKIELTRHD